MSTRSCLIGPLRWKRFSSGNVVSASRSMSANQALVALSCSLSWSAFLHRISRARRNAAVKLRSLKPSWFPTARCHSCPRTFGLTPRHQSSRVPRSETAVFHSGQTYCSQSLFRLSLVSSFWHFWVLTFSSLLFSASIDFAIIFWYSFKCLFSSLGSLGGSQDGRVRDKIASFSLDMGIKSKLPFCTGGSGTALGLELRLEAASKLGLDSLLTSCRSSSSLRSAISA